MRYSLLSTVAMSAIAAAVALSSPVIANSPKTSPSDSPQDAVPTATPIKHLVIIFQENNSFDHYFATYPNAVNPPGEPAFKAAKDTPAVNNLVTANLLVNNPNFTNTANGPDAADPFRLDRTQAFTADQSHGYGAEESAYDNGKADLFPKFTGKGTPGGAGTFGSKRLVMGYFDGNTVTALWNYAQHFAMSDNAYSDTYGPSTPGALEVVSGQTNGVIPVVGTGSTVKDGQGGLTANGDIDPAFDVCSDPTKQAQMTAKNIGDLLNGGGLSWGWFMGGFNLQAVNANGTTGCKRSTRSTVSGNNVGDYIPHHGWFQFYASTANPKHTRPSSLAAIGHSTEQDGKTPEPANHGYDLQDFYDSLAAGNFPSVSYIKMPHYQDGHPSNSDPLDEQQGLVDLVNFLQQQPDWKNTAVIITYDDSDGWYDHAYTQPTSSSFAASDTLNGPSTCGSGTQPIGVTGKPVNGRCGPGTRIPFLVVSPFAKKNFVSHDRITQASVVRFIEDNWLKSQRLGSGSFDAGAGSILDMFDFGNGPLNRKLILDATTGTVVSNPPVTSNGH